VGYQDTFIAVAEDCPVEHAVVPPERGAWPTVAWVQYAMLAAGPYTLTQEDVLFESWYRRQDVPPGDRAELRDQFFTVPRVCLRASPLPKRYGWGLHFDADGRIALCGVESAEYARYTAGGDEAPTVLRAMRSKRS